MKLKVNEDLCIACGQCVGNAREVFEFNGEGFAQVKMDVIPKEYEEEAIDAKEGCPTDAIEEVEE